MYFFSYFQNSFHILFPFSTAEGSTRVQDCNKVFSIHLTYKTWPLETLLPETVYPSLHLLPPHVVNAWHQSLSPWGTILLHCPTACNSNSDRPSISFSSFKTFYASRHFCCAHFHRPVDTTLSRWAWRARSSCCDTCRTLLGTATPRPRSTLRWWARGAGGRESPHPSHRCCGHSRRCCCCYGCCRSACVGGLSAAVASRWLTPSPPLPLCGAWFPPEKEMAGDCARQFLNQHWQGTSS